MVITHSDDFNLNLNDLKSFEFGLIFFSDFLGVTIFVKKLKLLEGWLGEQCFHMGDWGDLPPVLGIFAESPPPLF